jgi:hypothetical protein
LLKNLFRNGNGCPFRIEGYAYRIKSVRPNRSVTVLFYLSEIARILHVEQIHYMHGYSYLRQQAKENITRYVDERLTQAYEKCLVDLKQHLERSVNDVSKGIVNIQIRCK